MDRWRPIVAPPWLPRAGGATAGVRGPHNEHSSPLWTVRAVVCGATKTGRPRRRVLRAPAEVGLLRTVYRPARGRDHLRTGLTWPLELWDVSRDGEVALLGDQFVRCLVQLLRNGASGTLITYAAAPPGRPGAMRWMDLDFGRLCVGGDSLLAGNTGETLVRLNASDGSPRFEVKVRLAPFARYVFSRGRRLAGRPHHGDRRPAAGFLLQVRLDGLDLLRLDDRSGGQFHRPTVPTGGVPLVDSPDGRLWFLASTQDDRQGGRHAAVCRGCVRGACAGRIGAAGRPGADVSHHARRDDAPARTGCHQSAVIPHASRPAPCRVSPAAGSHR
jgi:hypothetical protein